MADSRVASRYVKSLLVLAVEQNSLDVVHNDMQMFDRACRTNRQFANMLKNPINKHEKKKDILEALFKGKVNPLTLAIIGILTRKNREPLLPAIAHEFHNAYNEYKGIEKASVTTTIAVDAKLKGEIEAIVKKLSTRTQVELVEKVDKDLIGGFFLNPRPQPDRAPQKNEIKYRHINV